MAEHKSSLLARTFLILWRLWLRLTASFDKTLELLHRTILLRGHVFDDEWYYTSNPDLTPSIGNAVEHFMRHGRYEGRKARFFDPGWYFLAHRDVRSTRLDAWTHYRQYGRAEGRVARFHYLHSSLDYYTTPPFQEWARLYDTQTDEELGQMAKISRHLNLQVTFDILIHIGHEIKTPDQIKALLQGLSHQIYTRAHYFIAAAEGLDKPLLDQINDWVSTTPHASLYPVSDALSAFAAYNRMLTKGRAPYILCLSPYSLPNKTTLFWFAYQAHLKPDATIIYADDDQFNEKKERIRPHFKTDFNYELFLSYNYIGDAAILRREVVDDLSGFDERFGQDAGYDLMWRIHDKCSSTRIVHIPRLLIHHPEIPARNAPSAQVVQNHLRRKNLIGDVLNVEEAPAYNRVRFALPKRQPLVSIIIPTRDRLELLEQAIESICTLTTWTNYEIIIVDNGSRERETLTYLANLPYAQIHVVRDERPFNFSALNNEAAKVANGEFLCLMNNDIEIITPDWLEEMMSFAYQKDVGCVGARLWYPDGKIQHAGVLIGFHGVAGHMHKLLDSKQNGYADRAVLHQSLSAVTAAVLLVRKSIYQAVGGLDKSLGVAFNDVDFCLKVRDAGYRNIYTPYAQMYHHESASRGAEDTPEKKRREQREITIMKNRYGKTLMNDPAYNSNLTLIAEDFSYAFPPRVQTISELYNEVFRMVENLSLE